MIRAGAVVFCIYLLVGLAERADVFSVATKKIIVATATVVGADVRDAGDSIHFGNLVVPWAEECGGFNLIVVLLGTTLWAHRREPRLKRLMKHVILALCLAILVNLARVITIVGYRWYFSPAIESAEFHYAIGFFWLVPALMFLTRRGGTGFSAVEFVTAAAVLGLLSVRGGAGGEWVLFGSTLLLLAQAGRDKNENPTSWDALAIWAAAGVVIALLRVESLWIAWTLSSPLLAASRAWTRLTGIGVMLGTISLVAASPYFWPIAIICWCREARVRNTSTMERAMPVFGRHRLPKLTFACCLLVLPFGGTMLPTLTSGPTLPPRGVMTQPVSGHGHLLRLRGQSPDLELVWYHSQTGERHHALGVCMRYRGVEIKEIQNNIYVGNDRWLREWYIIDGDVIDSYPQYLWRTSNPFTSRGAHVIASVKTSVLTAPQFEAVTAQIANQISASGH
jgi:exosortase/archaeosortase family protein